MSEYNTFQGYRRANGAICPQFGSCDPQRVIQSIDVGQAIHVRCREPVDIFIIRLPPASH